MKNTMYTLLLVVSSLISGCAQFPTHDIVIDVEKNPRVDMAGYKTFAWMAATTVLNDPEGKWQPLDYDLKKEVEFLITRELRKRQVSEVRSNSDLLVTYFIGVDMAAVKIKEARRDEMRLLQKVPKGALFVVLLDPATGHVVWASRAKAELKFLEASIAKKRLDYVVTNMFKKMDN